MSLRSEDRVISEKDAPVPAGAKVIEATYHRPYQAHAAIAPSCAVAEFKDGKLTVWTHSQGVFPLRATLARALGLPAARHPLHPRRRRRLLRPQRRRRRRLRRRHAGARRQWAAGAAAMDA